MAGAAGFEPTHARIKTWCLTAWRRPKNLRLKLSSCLAGLLGLRPRPAGQPRKLGCSARYASASNLRMPGSNLVPYRLATPQITHKKLNTGDWFSPLATNPVYSTGS